MACSRPKQHNVVILLKLELTKLKTRNLLSKLPILTLRGASLKLKGKIYRACVQRVMVCGSETWALKVENGESGDDDGKVDLWCDIEG